MAEKQLVEQANKAFWELWEAMDGLDQEYPNNPLSLNINVADGPTIYFEDLKYHFAGALSDVNKGILTEKHKLLPKFKG